MHLETLLQKIWNDVIATLKSQYDGILGKSNGAGRQQLAFIQQWSSSPFLDKIELLSPFWDFYINNGRNFVSNKEKKGIKRKISLNEFSRALMS